MGFSQPTTFYQQWMNLLSTLRPRITHIYGTTSQEPTTQLQIPTMTLQISHHVSQATKAYSNITHTIFSNEQKHLEIKSSRLSQSRRLIQTPRLNLLHQQFDSDIRVKIVSRFFIVCTKYKILRPTLTCSSCHDNNVKYSSASPDWDAKHTPILRPTS